ncbi:hypothetical protein [Halobaculum rubrum]|uniref:hypothetical protein n=1 Tax=Halobaculum rubrum TaxID=2872158 RepID=UPI001CA4131D|nr:hypothetical protein [Halobaculum rubrum]QZX99552.1 hypothetical protein K6T25_00085 [Halobaculum rubrum]
MSPDRPTFEFVTADDHVRARPLDSEAEPVLLPAGWADPTSTNGTWTAAVDAVVRAAVSGSGPSTPPVQRDGVLVVDHVVIREALSREGVVSADAAPAASAYLAGSGILPADDDTATIVAAGDDSTAGVYRWAALCDAVADAVADRAERLRDAVDRSGSDGTGNRSERLQEKRAGIEAEILDLAGDVDGSIEEALSPDELERFERLREEYHYYDSLLDGVSRDASPLSIDPIPAIDRAAAALDVTAARLAVRAGALRTATGSSTPEAPGAEAVAAAETAVGILREEGPGIDGESVHRLVGAGYRLAVADA